MPKRKPTISSSIDSASISSSNENLSTDPPPSGAHQKKTSPRPSPTVLTAEQAAALVTSMADRSADRCALCEVSFTEEIPPEPAKFGSYDVMLCHQCKERYENYRVV